MGLKKIEIWVHDHILKNDRIRHFIYGFYQRINWLFSKKIKCEGLIERITPKNEFEYLFGYYDKCPWSNDGTRLLALKVKKTTKEADSKDEAKLVIIDLKTKKEKEIAVTHCWNVQQGCMAEWLDDKRVIFNDFREGHYVSIVLDLLNNSERILSMPVYNVSPDKKFALSLDFSRLHRLRPGYGYCNLEESTKDEKCPDSTCIWRVDIDSGKITPILKYTDFLGFETKENMLGATHKVNHLMISPNGERFMVLHRWFYKKNKFTRLVTCSIDGTDMYNLSDDGFVSHCCWKDNSIIVSYLNNKQKGKGYFELRDKTHDIKQKWPKLVFDGHPSYNSAIDCFVTDTYPDRKRVQTLYILDKSECHVLARVFSPFKYDGNCRCDLHPRWSRDGKAVCFDGSFEGKREVYIVKV